MKKVRLGIIGLGTQGSTYAGLIADGKIENMTVGAVCDIDPAKQKVCPDLPFYLHYTDMLESGNIDAVVTTVPHYLHPEMGIAALNRSIHVLVEKPAGVYAKQVRELNEAAASKPEMAFAVFFNQRTNPLYRKMKELVAAGEIGAIRRTNWISTTWWRPQSYYAQSEWRATWDGEGGGVLVNQAPHQIDLLQWICGMPEKVYANVQYGCQRDIPVEDEATVLLDYGNGATGVFITCTHDILGTDRFEISGDKGKLIVDGSKTLTVKRLHKPEQELNRMMTMKDVSEMMKSGSLPSVYEEEIIQFESVQGGQHAEVLRNFAAHILNGEPLVAPGSDGIHSVALANAIHLSSWLKKEVALPVDEELYLAELNRKIRDAE